MTIDSRFLGCSPGTTDLEQGLGELNDRHARGVRLRIATAGIIWLCAVLAWAVGAIGPVHVVGITVSMGAICGLGILSVPLFGRVRSLPVFLHISIVDHAAVISGYSAVVHFLGGIEATYLTPIYAVYIMYVGIDSAVRLPYALSSISALSFTTNAVMERLGVFPTRSISGTFYLPLWNEILILAVVAALLFVIAFVTSRVRDRAYRREHDLAAAMERVVESDRLKSEFLATVSHELRTPLTHIIGFTQLLLGGEAGEATPRQKEYLADVESSGHHLLALIEDILDLAQIEAGKVVLNRVPVSIEALVTKSVAMVRDAAAAKGLSVEVRTAHTRASIRADQRRLRQVLVNLLANAVKFTPSGGRVVVETRDSLGATPGAAPGVEFRVADTGVGISQSELPRLFRRFERARHAQGHREPGTGLGLAIAKSLVELHGGEIRAESGGEGKGATFRFVVPAAMPSGASDG